MMGECCRKGTGVEKSANKAAEWYEKAAEQEYAPAQYRLGCCYEDKDGKTYDAFKAAELFRKAAEKDEKKTHSTIMAGVAKWEKEFRRI